MARKSGEKLAADRAVFVGKRRRLTIKCGMHIVSLVCGILGLVSMSLLAAVHSPAPLFLGLALGVVAIVTGILSRGQSAGKAGLALGLLGVVGMGAFFFLFMSRAVPSHQPTMVTVPEATSAR